MPAMNPYPYNASGRLAEVLRETVDDFLGAPGNGSFLFGDVVRSPQTRTGAAWGRAVFVGGILESLLYVEPASSDRRLVTAHTIKPTQSGGYQLTQAEDWVSPTGAAERLITPFCAIQKVDHILDKAAWLINHSIEEVIFEVHKGIPDPLPVLE